jgi:hypothetical protein
MTLEVPRRAAWQGQRSEVQRDWNWQDHFSSNTYCILKCAIHCVIHICDLSINCDSKSRWHFTSLQDIITLSLSLSFSLFNTIYPQLTPFATSTFIRLKKKIVSLNKNHEHLDHTTERLRWSRGRVLTFVTQVRGFAPCRSRRIFRAKKLFLRTPSFGGEVKPSVPCHSFTACKLSLNVTWKSE